MNPQPQRPCATCGRPFPLLANNPRKRYCTPRCRVADWHHRNDRTRNTTPIASTPDGVQADNDVPIQYGVPNAVTRCPHCALPVAVISLLITPAAAHIATPAAAASGLPPRDHPTTEVITMPDR
jgi:endogenous inhibitor of DNA gyrase (YacG/DUF329 family)